MTVNTSLRLLFAITILLISCSKDGNVDNAGEFDVVELTNTPMFTALKETKLRINRAPESYEKEVVRFKAPDSWKVTAERPEAGSPSEIIIVQERGWELLENRWIERDSSRYRSSVLFFIAGLTPGAFEGGMRVLGRGPILDDETTVRLAGEDRKFGEATIERFKRAASDQGLPAEAIKEIEKGFAGVKGRVELIVGEDSHRILQAKVTISGQNLNMEQTFTFDYHSPVVINPPGG